MMFNSSLEEGIKTLVFGECDVITNRVRRGAVRPASGTIGAWRIYVFKDVRVRVYTARARSASRFTFFDDGKEGLPIERKKDTGCEDAGLLEERGE